jgi:hypothetical protein
VQNASAADPGASSVDRAWLARVSTLIRELEALRWRYTEGVTGRGRARMGILNSTGCSSVWGSTFPFNPYPFPWANHLFQDSPSLAMGVFEGHMAKMAAGFRTVREAELELAGAQARPRIAPRWRTSTGGNSRTRNTPSVRPRWWSAATARCTTSASRTCRGR